GAAGGRPGKGTELAMRRRRKYQEQGARQCPEDGPRYPSLRAGGPQLPSHRDAMANRGRHLVQRTSQVAATPGVHTHHEHEELSVVGAECASETLQCGIEADPETALVEEPVEELSGRAPEFPSSELEGLGDRQSAAKREADRRSQIGEIALSCLGPPPAFPASPDQGNGYTGRAPDEQSDGPGQDPPDRRPGKGGHEPDEPEWLP